ncbi:MAG: RNA methyltransferase [Flavobacterium sp.]|nr:RNA methyltransferase [Flavobacterium sp.]
MISKNQIKLITALHQKKYRQQHQLFIAEGEKIITEFLMSNYQLDQLYVLEGSACFNENSKKAFVSESDLKKISCLSAPNNCIAVFKMPHTTEISDNGLKIVLDDLQDPGNLGTIIRLCDWFGVADLICSLKTVDLYNPKVVQASMGSLARVSVTYCNLSNYLKNTIIPIYGTFMDGANVYNQILPADAILVLGNEGNGISDLIEPFITKKVAIPRFGTLQKTESLNVANATAIFLSEFRRNG